MTDTTTDLASALEAAAGRLDEPTVTIKCLPATRQWRAEVSGGRPGEGQFVGPSVRAVLAMVAEHLERGTYS